MAWRGYLTQVVVRWRDGLLLLGVGLLLAGCATPSSLPPPLPPQQVQQSTYQQTLAAQLQQVAATAYKIGPGDIVRVQVVGKPSLSRDVTVNDDGTIMYPQLGKISASGLTLPQLEGDLQLRAKQTRRGPTTFIIAVVKQRTLLVNVLGEVRRPGVYRVKPTATVLDLISHAGGPTPDAGWMVLVIGHEPEPLGVGLDTEREDTISRSIRLDLEQLMAGESLPPVPIESGDTLYVPKAGQFFVSGNVQRPGPYRLQRDTTVLKAVSQAGGFIRYASKKRLTVWRYHPHDTACGGDLCLSGITAQTLASPPQEYRVRLHDRLQPGDVLVVR